MNESMVQECLEVLVDRHRSFGRQMAIVAGVASSGQAPVSCVKSGGFIPLLLSSKKGVSTCFGLKEDNKVTNVGCVHIQSQKAGRRCLGILQTHSTKGTLTDLTPIQLQVSESRYSSKMPQRDAAQVI